MRRTEGVTLLELMVVVLIVGILAAIAIPAYNDYITRSRRSDAFTALETVRAAQEMYRAEKGQYQTALGSLPGCSFNLDNYTIALPAAAAATFTVSATPRNTQAGDFSFSVDQNGTKQYNKGAGWITVTSWEDLPRH
jgi:type IV pilus assembly protein PilE